MKRNKMKGLLVLAVALGALGLTACGGTVESQDPPATPTVIEQGIEGMPDSNADTNTNSNVSEQDSPQEQLVGRIQTIDEMSMTIDTSGFALFNEPGEHRISPPDDGSDDETETPALHEIDIRLTEQTTIELRTLANAQIVGTSPGTLADLSLHAIVMVDGQWQDDEFIATNVIIMSA